MTHMVQIIKNNLLLLVVFAWAGNLQADGLLFLETAKKRRDEHLAAGRSAACALDVALTYYNDAYTGVSLLGALGPIIALPYALAERGKLFDICSNGAAYNQGWHAYGIISNKTDYEITIEVSYAGFCKQVKIPARTDNFLFEIMPQHLYGLKCRIQGTDYAVYGYRGTFVGGGLALLAGRACGGDLSIIGGKLRLTNACGLGESDLADKKIPQCS